MNQWILNPTLVDFNTGTATPQNWGVPFPYRVENAAHDQSGNLLFYIQGLTVYNPDGTQAGNLPHGYSVVTGYTYWDILHEIAIAPVPGTCKQFYIIYCLNRGFVGNALKHATITVNTNGSLTISTDTNVLAQNSGNSGAIAVSPDEGAGRKLYWVSANGGVFKYDITATGILPLQTLVGYSPNDPQGKKFQAKEAEVMGDNLIWVENDKVFSTSAQIGTEQPISEWSLAKRSFWGIEFDEGGAGFYVSTETNVNGVITGGIYHYPNLIPGNPPVLVANTANYTRTLIEKGKNGQYYAVNMNGVLGQYVGNGPAVGAFNNLTVFSSQSNPIWSGPYYKLPDQIDGENYDDFSGVAALNITGMQINGIGLADAVPPPPVIFYDCNPISLSTQFTGEFCEYTLQIFSVDPATGNQLFGAPYLNFSTSGTGNIPSPIDLKTIGGGSNLFANYLGQTFAIRIIGINCCGQRDLITCYFRVFGAPAPATIDLQVNPGNGVPCPAAHNIASPCLVSIYTASLNMGNSQGDISFYQIKIAHVNCSDGSVISDFYNGPKVDVSGVLELTALGLNDLEDLEGYFVDKCCRCYRIEVTIGNACGSSTDYTYVKFTLPNCNCFSGGGGGEERAAGDHPVTPGQVFLAPNPVMDQLQFFPVEDHGGLPLSRSLTVFSAQGSVAIRLADPDLGSPIEVRSLPPGMYSYVLETVNGPITGKFVKI